MMDSGTLYRLFSCYRGVYGTSALLLLILLLAGCVTPSARTAQPAVTKAIEGFNGLVDEVAGYELPPPPPTPKPNSALTVDTQNLRANIRSGPGMNFSILAKANGGDSFQIVAKSEDNNWWQICCIANADGSKGDATGWIAASVVKIAGADGVDISKPVLNPQLDAKWAVDWQCGSDRCEVKECKATVEAKVGRTPSQQLLAIDHQVVWDKECFAQDSWVFEVNQYTGQERTGDYKDNFLYGYWLGQQPGTPNGVYKLTDGQANLVFCSGPHTVEIDEGEGWTTVYEGNTCHDVRTGMIVYLSYNKRWLYTGEYKGQKYDKAYFGDFETLEQKLLDTNLDLMFVKKK